MCFDDIIAYIRKLYNDYVDEYLQEPENIIIPYNIYRVLDCEHRTRDILYTANGSDNVETIFGMIIYITYSSKDIGDIKVY